MKILVSTLTILLTWNLALAQDREFKLNLPRSDANTTKPKDAKFAPASLTIQAKTDAEKATAFYDLDLQRLAHNPSQKIVRSSIAGFDRAIENTAEDTIDVQEIVDLDFHWRPAMIQSGLFLAMQHGFRLTEEKTRKELNGPFFADWKASVKNFRGWDDGGKIFTNYIGHPLQGALTSRIFIHNSGVARREQFGRSKTYWAGRMKAMVWSAVWSAQFEIGPISEASLGNVGQRPGTRNRSKMTYSDVILTPTLGTAFAVTEDAIDKHILKNWIELKFENRLLIKVLRSIFTPTTSFANILRGRAPWRRDLRRN